MTSERAKVVAAVALAVVAGVVFFAEPLPKGPVLLSLSRSHGIDLVDVVPLTLAVIATILLRSATRAPERPRPALDLMSAGGDRAVASPPERRTPG